MSKSYEKILTKNDTGETGGHQAGILVPKADKKLLEFFPLLDTTIFNPDAWITCIDPSGEQWEIRYIYYNGKTFTPPKSTRNEYRLTHMTKLLSSWGAQAGDSVVFTSTEKANHFKVEVRSSASASEEAALSEEVRPVVLKGWKPVF